MKPQPEFEVAIVGFSPSGAIAACWLGQAGVKTLVLDKSRTIWDIPRAIALDHEILRVFQNIGVIEQVLPHTAPFGASEHFGASGQLIRRIDIVPLPHPLGYLPNMVFTQPPVEAILRERAEAHTSVTVNLGWELFELLQEAEGVTLHVQDEAGNVEVRTAAYVIACDGASSTAGRLLGIPFDDLGFDEPWLVVDLVVHDAALIKLSHFCAQYCDPERPYTYIIRPGNHRRWEIMLSPAKIRVSWNTKRASRGFLPDGWDQLMADSGEEAAIDFTRWLRTLGEKATSSWPETPRISSLHS